MPRQEENEHRDTNPNILLRYVLGPFYFSPRPLFTTDHGIHNPGHPLKSSKPNAHDNMAEMGPMTTGEPKRRHEDTTGLTMAQRAKRLRHRPNDHIAGSPTLRIAQPQHEGPHNVTGSPTIPPGHECRCLIHDARVQTARYTNELTTNDRATPDNEDLGTGGMDIQGGVGSPTILEDEWLRPPALPVSQNVYSILSP
ncbi:hypothetical protein K443DRAFT_671097 [Laccaria amethystina LaAM-08-1]|uniref:Uncharacterized protein n=1 Tax=Laccaria amethystina LaAM-08-1 TaxID=1095629 RepID=A0A0C9YP18_9AGAR|nr:hypothetical protein K443DRAFT_671097 [Laccaria amethystina LaAM-08-1]